jgi:hypothetical protein
MDLCLFRRNRWSSKLNFSRHCGLRSDGVDYFRNLGRRVQRLWVLLGQLELPQVINLGTNTHCEYAQSFNLGFSSSDKGARQTAPQSGAAQQV